jgi:multiple sugar transport system permease protein
MKFFGRRLLNRYGSKVVVYLAAVAISLWVLIPMLLLILAALMPSEEIYQWPRPLAPGRLTIENLAFFFRAHGVVDSTVNSIIVGLLTVALSLIIGAPAGYALSRFRFRGRELFRLGILTTRMFPVMILSIPLAVIYIKLGLYDTLLGVTFMHTVIALPFAVLITASIFAGIPKEMEEMAMILGCSYPGAFVRVVLPIALPGLAAAAMFAFVISWNETFAASLLTARNPTLPAMVVFGLDVSPLNYRFAAGLFMIVPAWIFIFITRKYLIGMWGKTS